MEVIKEKTIPPKQRLIEFLVKMSDITVEYSQYTKATVPYALLERAIEEPYQILPMINECLGDCHCETECRIIAYQLITLFQIVFFRSDDFKKYSGLDVMNEQDRKILINKITMLCNNDPLYVQIKIKMIQRIELLLGYHIALFE